MRIAIPAETWPGERRVAATPDTVERLRKQGFTVQLQAGAGTAAGYTDAAYAAAGAEVVEDATALWLSAQVLLKVRPPRALDDETHEADLLTEGTVLLCLLGREDEALLARLAARRVSALGMEGIPRITRAQKVDVLSSMANIAGYRAVVEAAAAYRGFFGPQMTAAGKSPPARVLVIGAGVAGLAAIGAARALGAEVRAFDTRPEVKEQVSSMGAQFLELHFKEEGTGEGGYAKVMSEAFIAAEMALFRQQCAEVDIIITTALIPGRRAPVLITEDMLETLRQGSVVVDLAAENGGNCIATRADEVVEHHGVTVIGYTDLPSRMASVSSRFFANNLANLLGDMGGAADWKIDLDDEVVRGAVITHAGEILPPPPRKPPSPAPAPAPAAAPTPAAAPAAARAVGGHGHGHGHGAVSTAQTTALARPGRGTGVAAVVGAGILTVTGLYAPPDFIQHFTVFVLACVVGWQVVWNVTPALHTPLMSVTNAISGIILVGGILQAATGDLNAAAWLGALAILVASINIAGGFLVTQRMLQMFRK